MKTDATCLHCVKDGKPDSNCEIRGSCVDDASSTEKRKQILQKIPQVKVEPNDERRIAIFVA